MSLCSVGPIGSQGFDMTVFNKCFLETVLDEMIIKTENRFEGEENYL